MRSRFYRTKQVEKKELMFRFSLCWFLHYCWYCCCCCWWFVVSPEPNCLFASLLKNLFYLKWTKKRKRLTSVTISAIVLRFGCMRLFSGAAAVHYTIFTSTKTLNSFNFKSISFIFRCTRHLWREKVDNDAQLHTQTHTQRLRKKRRTLFHVKYIRWQFQALYSCFKMLIVAPLRFSFAYTEPVKPEQRKLAKMKRKMERAQCAIR